jgi:hypothetical protein
MRNLLILLLYSTLAVSSCSNLQSDITKPSPRVQSSIRPINVTKGRTADERVHEFELSPNQWVETNLLITPNQKVLIHHFASNERVTVNLGGKTFPPLQQPGTITPTYTSRNCDRDVGVKAKVKYYCVELNQAESIKLFASNSVRVGILVKNR